MIEAVCFDLDWVYFPEEGKKWFHKDLVTLVWDEEKVSDFLYKSEEMRSLCNWWISPESFREVWKNNLWINISLKEFADMWVKHYQIDWKVQKLIQRLKLEWYKVCTCTNNNSIRVNALEEKFNFKQDFDVFVSSHEVWFFKPDYRIFETLKSKLNLPAEKIVYTDDNLDRLSWAEDLGMKTYLFDTLEGYVDYLKWNWISFKKTGLYLSSDKLD